jgi:hypothetical protein
MDAFNEVEQGEVSKIIKGKSCISYSSKYSSVWRTQGRSWHSSLVEELLLLGECPVQIQSWRMLKINCASQKSMHMPKMCKAWGRCRMRRNLFAAFKKHLRKYLSQKLPGFNFVRVRQEQFHFRIINFNHRHISEIYFIQSSCFFLLPLSLIFLIFLFPYPGMLCRVLSLILSLTPPKKRFKVRLMLNVTIFSRRGQLQNC